MNALEQVDESFMARHNIPHPKDRMLCECDKGLRKNNAPRGTPIPVKIGFAGENG